MTMFFVGLASGSTIARSKAPTSVSVRRKGPVASSSAVRETGQSAETSKGKGEDSDTTLEQQLEAVRERLKDITGQEHKDLIKRAGKSAGLSAEEFDELEKEFADWKVRKARAQAEEKLLLNILS